MLVVARLDRANHLDRREIGTRERAIVHHLFDARARGGDLRREIGKTSWTITDDRGESAQPAVRNQAAFDHPAEHIRIDVAAAQEQHDTLAFELVELA